VLFFSLAVSILTGLLFGIVPALRTAKLDLRETLNEGSRGSTSGPGHHRVRGLLVVTDIALAMLLLAGSGLLLRSLFDGRQDNSASVCKTDAHQTALVAVQMSGCEKCEIRLPTF